MIYFLLPAYNEEDDLPKVLTTISGLNFPDEDWHVVVVDDGSTDSTPNLLKEWSEKVPLTVLTHAPNRGLGRAMRTGLIHLGNTASDDDAVIALDADNTQDPNLAVRMREKQRSKGLDIVIASRYFVESDGARGEEIGLALHRKILSRGASWLLDTAFHVGGATDYTCGFRLYTGNILRHAAEIYGDGLVEEKNFVCMAEILIKLANIGAKVGEVPLRLRYDLKGGASKMKVMQTVFRYLGMIWRYKVGGELKKYR